MTDIEQYRQLLGGGERTKNVLEQMISHAPTQSIYEHWTGKVISNSDPDRLGRCQIRVIGYYENLEDKWLPWAVPDISYMGGKCGSQIIPEVGTMVRGYFEKGDVQRPVFTSIAFNKYNSDSDYTSRKSFFDYPHKMVMMETDQGDFLTLNRKTGELVFTHRTGAQTLIDGQGNISINTGNTPSMGNMTINVYGKCELNANDNVKIWSAKDVQVQALGFIDLGDNPVKNPINNLTNCPICGIVHSTAPKVRC